MRGHLCAGLNSLILLLQLDGFQTLCIRPMHCTLRMDASRRVRDFFTYRTAFSFTRLEQRCRFSIVHTVASGSVYETHYQDAGCQWGSGFVPSVESSFSGSNALVILRHGSVNGVVRRMTSTGRSCVRCSVTVSSQQSAGCPRLESSDVLCARSLRS